MITSDHIDRVAGPSRTKGLRAFRSSATDAVVRLMENFARGVLPRSPRCYDAVGVGIVDTRVWLGALGALAGLGVGVACGSPSAFACGSHGQCGPSGTCEPSGYCSFPDADCPSQARYGEYAAPELAGTCVEPETVEDGSGTEMTGDSDGSTSGPSPEPTSETGVDEGTTGAPDPTTSADPACGDGVEDPGELCDDGNAIDGDGCNLDCTESGTLLWSITVDGGGSDLLDGLAPTSAGFVASGGQTTEVTGQDGFVAGYSADGTSQWSTLLDGGAGGDDRLRRVAVGPSGNIYASGWTNQAGDDLDVWVVALDPSGDPLWDHVWTSPGSDGAVDIAVDTDGVYVGGCVRSGEAAFVRRFAFEGTIDWTLELPPEGDDACVHGLLAVGDGVVAGGWTSTVETGGDMWVAKFDPLGAQLWSDHHLDPGEDDKIHDVVAVGDGDILAVGRLGSVDDLDMWLRRYTADGDIVSTWEDDTPGQVSALDAVPAEDGGVVVVGWEQEQPDVGMRSAFVHKLDAQGVSQWRRTISAEAKGAAWLGQAIALEQGGILAAGYIDQATRDGLVAAFSR